MMQTCFRLKKEATNFTTSQPTPFHDHVTHSIHQEIHLEEETNIKKNKEEKQKE